MAAQKPDSSQLLTANELAATFKLNPQTVYRLARRGAIPSIRIGPKSLRFDPTKVRAVLEGGGSANVRVGPTQASAAPFTVTWLADLRAADRWMSPRRDLALERFAVRVPKRADLTKLAYERTG